MAVANHFKLWMKNSMRSLTVAACALIVLPLLYALLTIDLRTVAVRWLYADALHTYLAPGQLGNRVFQNLAVSLLAEKFDLVAHYDRADDFRALGLRLHSGRLRLDGGDRAPLDNQLLQHLLVTRATRTTRGLIIEHPHSYFQTPWFARVLRVYVASMREGVLAANPWRSRFGANNDTCVHLRLGTLVDPLPPLPERFYERIGAAIGAPPGAVFVATDDPDATGAVALVRRLGATLLHPREFNVVQTVQFIASCRHLVLSGGTMGWLAGALALNSSSVRYVLQPKWQGDIYVFPDWEHVA